MKPFIVAEVSKTWVDGREIEPGLLCEYFEVVINVYYQRGYRLLTFSLNRVMTRPDELNETIIAVFEAVQPDENR